MTTSATFSVLDHTSDAGFRAWGAEFHGQLLACGLTLTADTGQINWTTVVRPAVNVQAGYEVWRFNDTLQSTTPVYLIFSFGTANAVANPKIWVTVCGATNGAGVAVGYNYQYQCGTGNYGTPPASTTSFYPSRFCYNATLGFFGFVWKIGGFNYSSSTNAAYQSFFVFRSNNSAGAATGDTVNVLTSGGQQASTITSGAGVMSCMNFSQGTTYPLTPTLGQYWAFHPFMNTSTIAGNQLAVDPVFFMTPGVGISNSLSRGLISEIPMGSQVSLTLVGATAYNYIQVGCPFNSNTTVAYTGLDASTQANPNIGLLMLWQ